MAVRQWVSGNLLSGLPIAMTTNAEAVAEPERKLCVTVDAYSGTVYSEASNSILLHHVLETRHVSRLQRGGLIFNHRQTLSYSPEIEVAT